MAHQAYTLPWQTLADNFKYMYANTRFGGITNLYPRQKPGQGKQLQHFARVFARVLTDYSKIERKKYDEEYSPPDHDDDIIISDTTMAKIQNVVNEFMMKDGLKYDAHSFQGSGLSRMDRTLAAWVYDSTEYV